MWYLNSTDWFHNGENFIKTLKEMKKQKNEMRLLVNEIITIIARFGIEKK